MVTLVVLSMSLALSSEVLVVVSNFLLALATFLMYFASERENHATIRTVVKANSALMRYIVKLLAGKPKQK